MDIAPGSVPARALVVDAPIHTHISHTYTHIHTHLQVVVCACEALEGLVQVCETKALVVLTRTPQCDHKGTLPCATRCKHQATELSRWCTCLSLPYGWSLHAVRLHLPFTRGFTTRPSTPCVPFSTCKGGLRCKVVESKPGQLSVGNCLCFRSAPSRHSVGAPLAHLGWNL